MEVFLQALVNGILLGGFYSLMGMGQNIIFGVMNIVNFCHGEMLMVGMYITYVLYTYFGVDPYVALPIVAVLMFGLGALIQSTLITPSLKTTTESHAVFINCFDPGGSQFSIVFLLIDLLQCSFRRLLRICRDHPAVMS